MAEIALAQEPLEVAIGGRLHAGAAQGRFLAAVTHGVGFVAVLAMLAVDQSTRRNRIGMGGERIDTIVVLCGHVFPMRRCRCAEK